MDLEGIQIYLGSLNNRNIFETVLSVKKPGSTMTVPHDDKNLDGLNYIAGKPLHEVNHQAETGTTLAHLDGDVPNLRIEIPEIRDSVLDDALPHLPGACGIRGFSGF